MFPSYATFQMCNFDTDIGTEELAHLEMVAAIIHQLTRNLSMEQIEASGFRNYYVDHTVGIWPQAAGGVPFTTAQFQSTGDIITDLTGDMAAEQKARTAYDNILRLVKNEPDVYEPIKFLRAREVVHFQRFGEANRTDLGKFKRRIASASFFLNPFYFFPKYNFNMYLNQTVFQDSLFHIH